MKAWVPIIILILILIGSAYLLTVNNSGEVIEQPKTKNTNTGNSNSEPSNVPNPRTVPTYVPLTEEEVTLIEGVVEASEFISDIPEDNPISLEFFYFEEGYRVYQDEFIFADGNIQESGDALIELTMHSKYLEDIKGGSTICDMVKNAKSNGDLGFWSELSETKLAWEYKGLIKHKECFGL